MCSYLDARRQKDGYLFELDGRKAFPINHGATTPETLLEVRACVYLSINLSICQSVCLRMCPPVCL